MARVVFNVLDWIIGSIGLGNNDIARIICSHGLFGHQGLLCGCYGVTSEVIISFITE